MVKMYLAAAGAALMTALSPAAAITAFATFTPTSNASNLDFSAATSTVTSTPGSFVTFRFLDPTGTTAVFDTTAAFNFSATIANGAVLPGAVFATATSGSTSFTTAAPVSFNGRTGTNLLTATFTGGLFTGVLGGSSASYINSLPPSAVTFTSDFVDFTQSTARDISIAVTSINPLIDVGSGGINDFSGTAGGLFGADVSAGSPLDVPEPAAWAMMVVGFGLIGTATRRRSRLRAVEA